MKTATEGPVTILSLYYDKLIVSSVSATILQVIDIKKNYTLRILYAIHELKDAVWLSNGNILCVSENGRVWVMNEMGVLIFRCVQKFDDVQCLSLSYDNKNIYLASGKNGVFQSTDGGFSWLHVFKSREGWRFIQSIRVCSGDKQPDNYWVVETLNETWRVNIYCGKDLAGKCINVENRVAFGRKIMFENVRLEYVSENYSVYGNKRVVYVPDYFNHDVYVYSAIGHYQHALFSYVIKYPTRLIFDSQRKRLYVGQNNGDVAYYEYVKDADVLLEIDSSPVT